MKTLVLLKDTALYWHRNQAARLSAALTYYALASLTPMLVLLLAVAGLFFSPERAGRFLTGPVEAAIGEDNAAVLEKVVDNAGRPGASLAAGVSSLLVVMLTGSELFRQLGFTLNSFWQTPEPPSTAPLAKRIFDVVAGHLLYRLRATLLVLGAGLLLLATLLVSTWMSLTERLLGLDAVASSFVWSNRLFMFLSSAVLFALIYRTVPKLKMAWRPVLAGAMVAALLYTLLGQLMNLYLSSAGIGSAFGAAGSLVVMLFWLYYSIQAMFFGAAWARVGNELAATR